MLLSYKELCELVEQGVINAPLENVNASSIDITLAQSILLEDEPKFANVVNLAKSESVNWYEFLLRDSYQLMPGDFILASSVEVFNLPLHISAEFSLKSTLARNGLEHLMAGWIDAGFTNSKLTLELKNATRKHRLVLTAGMKIGQVKLFKHEPVPIAQSYSVKGQYNNAKGVQRSKTLR